MNVNIHIPLSLGSSLFNRLLKVGCSGYFQESPLMRDCLGLDQGLALLTLCVVCFAVLSKRKMNRSASWSLCGTGQVTPGEGIC